MISSTPSSVASAAAAALASAAEKLLALSGSLTLAPREYRQSAARWVLGGSSGLLASDASLAVDVLVGLFFGLLIGVIAWKGCCAFVQLGYRAAVTLFFAAVLLAACQTLAVILSEYNLSTRTLILHLLQGAIRLVAGDTVLGGDVKGGRATDL